MSKEFVRIKVFRSDYSWLRNKFSEDETRPAQGALVSRACVHIAALEAKLASMDATLKETVK